MGTVGEGWKVSYAWLGSGLDRVGRPDHGPVGLLDDHIPVVLHHQEVAGRGRVGRPDGAGLRVIQHQAAAALHHAHAHGTDDLAGRHRGRQAHGGVRGPQRLAAPFLIEHQVSVLLVDQGIVSVLRGDGLAGVQDFAGLHVVAAGEGDRLLAVIRSPQAARELDLHQPGRHDSRQAGGIAGIPIGQEPRA
jgi:hypothetical protein